MTLLLFNHFYIYSPSSEIKTSLKSRNILKRTGKMILLILKKKSRFSCLQIWVDMLIGWRRRQWHPTPRLFPGKSHGRRSLVGCSPWGHKELDTTERLHFHFSLSCIGEGNGNPLQCSCLENLRDWEAWWAAVSGVTQSWT